MKTIIVAGSPSSGKTSVSKHLIHHLKESYCPSVCKIDCLSSPDQINYKKLNIPVVQGLSEDICPDHFLATNLIDIFNWGHSQKSSHLFIETAGLCNRCAPFVDKAINLCIVDAMGSIQSPEKLGPIITTADLLIVTKGDLITQAEREVLFDVLEELNQEAPIFEVNGLSGYGSQRLVQHILKIGESMDSLEGALLKYEMPSANCSYCVGEMRIGKDFQQGMITRMTF